MRKTTKAWLITAASLVLTGCILFAVVMSTLGWDFLKLSTVKYEINTYELAEAFSDISVTTDTADIVFALSDDGKCRVECLEEENAKHSVAVEEGTLVIRRTDIRAWYDYLGFRFGTPKITVYLPKADAGSVTIKAGTGDIRVEDISVSSLDISVTTGAVTVTGVTCRDDIMVDVSTGEAFLTDISCKNLISNGATGSIFLGNVIAAGKFSIERGTGSVSFDGSDAAEIFVKTATGNVDGSLLTDKVFVADTATGSVDVPRSETGGRCEIETGTGNIAITIG